MLCKCGVSGTLLLEVRVHIYLVVMYCFDIGGKMVGLLCWGRSMITTDCNFSKTLKSYITRYRWNTATCIGFWYNMWECDIFHYQLVTVNEIATWTFVSLSAASHHMPLYLTCYFKATISWNSFIIILRLYCNVEK